MKKLYGIAFLVAFCFSLALLNPGTNVIENRDISISFANSSANLSSLSLSYPNSEIEICTIHSNPASQRGQGFQKIVGYIAAGTRTLNKYTAFSFSDNSLPGYLFHKEYLFHIYPSHNFW